MNLTVTILMIAVMLYVAARLIMSVLPVLIVSGVVVFIGYVGWSIYQFRKSRW